MNSLQLQQIQMAFSLLSFCSAKQDFRCSFDVLFSASVDPMVETQPIINSFFILRNKWSSARFIVLRRPSGGSVQYCHFSSTCLAGSSLFWLVFTVYTSIFFLKTVSYCQFFCAQWFLAPTFCTIFSSWIENEPFTKYL